jgi:hypothetical protein
LPSCEARRETEDLKTVENVLVCGYAVSVEELKLHRLCLWDPTRIVKVIHY